MKRVSLKTIGCRLNQAETALIAAQFEQAGCQIVPFGAPCDVAVIHTCAVTGKAERDGIRYARSISRLGPRPLIVLAGCAVEVDADKQRRQSGADILAGQRDKYRLPELIERRLGNIIEAQPAASPPVPRYERTRAILKVQDGCDFCCSYCIVPKARGAPASRPFGEILDEARKLSDHGFKEIVLTGANLACYADGKRNLIHVLESLEKIPGFCRIRLSSIEVSTIENDLIDFMAGSQKLCRYIHLPLQSGDDGILKAMRRRYDSTRYRTIIEYAVGKVPLLGIGTDIIVGFPGEDQAAYANTVKFVKELPFSNLHVFSYSERPGTKAALFPGKVRSCDIKSRTRELITIGREKGNAFAKRFVGRKVCVLLEKLCRAGRGIGWTSEYVQAQVFGQGLKENECVEFTPTNAEDGMLV